MKYDLHIHSRFSDGTLTPAQIIEQAKKLGLNGVAITDHNTTKGGEEAKKINSDPDFEVIVGEEISTASGDIIGLFLEDEIITNDILEAVKQIHSQGGLAILPHPYRSHTLNDELLRQVDAVEVENARTDPKRNQEAKELAKIHQKPMVAGSDAHMRNEIGRGTTEFTGDLRTAILSNQTKLTYRQIPLHQVYLTAVIVTWRRKHFLKFIKYTGLMIKYFLWRKK